MAKRKTVETCGGLIEFLAETNSTSWKKYHNGRTCYEAYIEIKKNLCDTITETEKGAMAVEVGEILNQFKEQIAKIMNDPDEKDPDEKIHRILSEDPIIFLNNHGHEHINQVINRADAMVEKFNGEPLSEFEVFVLLCAIEIHDIGNILGRAGHEKKLQHIFDEHVKDIIPDTAERRIIKNVAMAHGGKTISGSKDTISPLSPEEMIFDNRVRTRLLAAILRFADELADDSTRKSRASLELGIIGTNSKIYQDYSRVLHTVYIEKDDKNNYFVRLVYELEVADLKEIYVVGHSERYLLDEIYDRTLKMERERRYCLKFMRGNLNIEKIVVNINIYGKLSLKVDTITYTLEDIGYPCEPISGNIKEVVGITIRNGKEELEYAIGKDVISNG